MMEDDYCTNCETEDERVYVGSGEFVCNTCYEITDWNRVPVEEQGDLFNT